MISIALLESFFTQYGYAAVFLVLIACGFGVPIPEDVTLVTGGVISGLGYANVHIMFLVGMAGVLAGDGMMSITVRLPAAEGQLVRQTLAREAASVVAAGSVRSRAQVMADVVVGRVTGRDPVATPVPVTLNLVMSDETLLTGGEQPAQLDGYGPIPAVLARDLVTRDGVMLLAADFVLDENLIRQLRELEDDGLVSRKVYGTVPPRVDYALTPLGESLVPIMESLKAWGNMYEKSRSQTEPDHGDAKSAGSGL